MPREENLLILKMLQDGSINAEQAAELLAALEKADAPAAPVPPVPPTPPAPPTPPTPPANTIPLPPNLPEELRPAPPPPVSQTAPNAPVGAKPAESDLFDKARERIAKAREKMAQVQERLAAAEERVNKAEGSPNAVESLSDALKDVPGAKAVADALRDPSRLAGTIRRQTRKIERQVRSSLDDLNIDFNFNFANAMHGEPTLSAPREASAPIPPGGTLRVRSSLGDIEAVGADVPEARVAGVLKIWAADRAAAEALADQINLTIEQGADGPTIAVAAPNKPRRVQLNLKVFVPQGTSRVSLLSPSGDVSLRGVKAGAVLATQSGDVKASEIAGDVAAETASGDIGIEGVTGNITASSASGDVQVVRVTGQKFRAVSQSGDVRLNEATIPVVSVETVSGDVRLEQVSGRTLKVRAVSGDVSTRATDFSDDSHLDAVSGSIAVSPRAPLTKSNLTLATISGDVSVTLPTPTDAQLDISTKGGEARAKFQTGAGDDAQETTFNVSGMSNLSYKVGSGAGAQIAVSSVSGDVNVSQEAEE